jgi:hypothetical protein
MAPELIILRVARGKAWTSTTNSEMTRSREAMGMVDGKSRASTLEEKDVV